MNPFRRGTPQQQSAQFWRAYNKERDAYICTLQNDIANLRAEIAGMQEGINWHKHAGAQLTSRLAKSEQAVTDLLAALDALGYEPVRRPDVRWSNGPFKVTITPHQAPTTRPEECRRT